VFKTRTEHEHRLASSGSSVLQTAAPAIDTVQRMNVKVAHGALLLLLVDPVTCFRAASYTQHQTFHLEPDASLVVLDWLTAGRMSRDEEWAFAKYHSINEVWRAGRRIARDVMLLEQLIHTAPLPSRTLKDRMAPYSCYATMFMFGPMVTGMADKLAAEYDAISQMQRSSPPDFVWSLSMVDGGCIVRAAGLETEAVKNWLKDALADLATVIGDNTFQKAFS
jgi:urease accessory protein